jgi:Zn-finger nucleic acid-binding protein
MSPKDYYTILGITPAADSTAISAAYKTLAHRYHPDVNRSPDANLRMQEINEAYDVLSDPDRRKEYDRERIVIASKLSFYCPRDYMSLELKLIYSARLDQCPHCQGLWIGRNSLEILCRQQGLEIPLNLTRERFDALGLNAGQLDCPNASTRMARIQHNDIEIDICSKCLGIWFDKDELQKIIALSPSKGRVAPLDRSMNILEDVVEDLMTFLEFTKSALNDLLD